LSNRSKLKAVRTSLIDYPLRKFGLQKIKLKDMAVQNMFENRVDNNIIWILLEFVSDDEQAFIKAGPIVRSLLASLIIQWESYQEQSTRNIGKTLGITMRLLNIINKSNLIKRPYCYIVDIIPMLNSFETHLLLLIIWKNLKVKDDFKF
ncbi:integrator complex subunit 5-like, partial [Brachionus plicatilis]